MDKAIQLTEQQKAALEDLARVVKSDFKSLSEADCIKRVMMVTGRPYEKALQGYKMLRDGNYLAPVLDLSTLGKFEAFLSKFPDVAYLVNSWDCIPVKFSVVPFDGLFLPRRTDPAAILRELNLQPLF